MPIGLEPGQGLRRAAGAGGGVPASPDTPPPSAAGQRGAPAGLPPSPARPPLPPSRPVASCGAAGRHSPAAAAWVTAASPPAGAEAAELNGQRDSDSPGQAAGAAPGGCRLAAAPAAIAVTGAVEAAGAAGGPGSRCGAPGHPGPLAWAARRGCGAPARSPLSLPTGRGGAGHGGRGGRCRRRPPRPGPDPSSSLSRYPPPSSLPPFPAASRRAAARAAATRGGGVGETAAPPPPPPGKGQGEAGAILVAEGAAGACPPRSGGSDSTEPGGGMACLASLARDPYGAIAHVPTVASALPRPGHGAASLGCPGCQAGLNLPDLSPKKPASFSGSTRLPLRFSASQKKPMKAGFHNCLLLISGAPVKGMGRTRLS
ncbi:translation initiation factor IF-2-like [Grus americana]|uniref:translation initiation factor IF-2-like n=1 Tax=Grus americana TaxID=9117 RepID=UPI0024077E9E|nr:translation initiation factor IF-2-like [Grus americana]